MAKENISKMKREPTVWENIFANDTSMSYSFQCAGNSPPWLTFFTMRFIFFKIPLI